MPHLSDRSFGRSVVFACALLTLGVCHAAPVTTMTNPVDALINRTLIVSFHPKMVPNAVGMVQLQVGANAGELFDLLQRPLSATRLLYREPTAVELRIAEIDPEAPEAMISKYIQVTYAVGTDLGAIQGQLAQDVRIRSVERMWKSSYSTPPTDEYFVAAGPFAERQWGMQNFNAVSNQGGMSFSTAWELVRGGAYINVLDDGIQTDDALGSVGLHPDLKANFRQHFSRNLSNPLVNYLRFGAVDERYEALHEDHPTSFGHGTHVAGIVAAASSRSQTTSAPTSDGVAGGCFNCALMVTKIGFDLFNEIIHATDVGAQVINRSGPQRVPQPTDCFNQISICQALERARNRGVIFVAASGNVVFGNPDHSIEFPANATSIDGNNTPLAIAVGGLNSDGTFWAMGYGPELGSKYGPQQAVIAPAQDVLSTFYRGQTWNADVHCDDQLNSNTNLKTLKPGYGDCNGTSMAAPHVSALAGLIKSADPLLNAAQTRTVLLSSASHWPTRDDQTGYGIPDAAKAVQKGLDGYGATDPVPSANKSTNRLTPLFSFFSPKALDHFYTTSPQMASAALDGTIKPQPLALTFVGSTPANSWPVCCTQVANPSCSYQLTSCASAPVPLPPGGVTIREQDGVTKVGGMPVALISNPSADPDTPLNLPTSVLGTQSGNVVFPVAGNSSPFYAAVTSSAVPASLGQLPSTNLLFQAGETQATLYAYPLNFLTVTYNFLDKDFPVDPNNPGWAPAIARKTPEFTAYPAYYCPGGGLVPCTDPYPHQPTASVRVFTSYKNPTGGADLVPLYRLSYVCRDGGHATACASNPYHISHAYSTDTEETFGSAAGDLPYQGYRLDGIEGYVFSKASQPPGTVKLCRKYSPARDDYVLFPGAGSGGTDCSATSFEGGTYNQTNSTFGDFLGYVYSVTSDTSPPSRAHANIQTGVFRNSVSPPVSQFILDFDFNGIADNAVNFGSPGDKGLATDMDNDGRADLVTFRVSAGQGVWTADLNRDGIPPFNVYYFGGDPADQPIIGKLHAASATTPDLAVYRNGIWYITFSPTSGTTGAVHQTCGFGGLPGDIPLAGDFNHDQIDDLVIYRGGIWYVHFMPSCTIASSADLTLAFGGVSGDTPLVADWDRDGIADLIIFRSPGYWYVSTRRDGYAQAYTFGAPSSGDKPLVARFNQ